MIDIDIFRFVVAQHFGAAREQEALAIGYSEYYALMVDELRFQGYEVSMQVGADGKLCYKISADASGKVA
ncbi:hypothetical protein LZZ85_17785 [Terrimonas sp. NA20]|uniref:Uncharacterized protein n=1 Tax=Terrimonas ginsenosidimutans TaxID=2908004 RepID=A0ABS9KV37_9BACT|nr:hypothetical protein [Terrimonas ginsenosidimutans]MCG2616153.1 hypothetical protein [Terrimonas ginsenosidimutans]